MHVFKLDLTASMHVVGSDLVHWNAILVHLVDAQQPSEKLCCACTTFRLSVNILLGCVCIAAVQQKQLLARCTMKTMPTNWQQMGARCRLKVHS